MSVRDDSPPRDGVHTEGTDAPASRPTTGIPASPTTSAPASPPLPARGPSTFLLRTRGAAAGFAGNDVVSGVDLEVRAGEIVAIVGRSGCGKTTLLHLLAGLVPATAGTVEGEPAVLMPQRDGLMAWATARDNAALPLRLAGMPRREARHLADGQLAALGLAGVGGRRVAALSGGMRQRVALARTLLSGRSLLLLDEPLAAVDALTRDELHELLLAHARSTGHGAVLVTHDLDEAVRLADRVLVLRPAAPGAPSTLNPGPALTGDPGQRLEHRGGEPLRAALRAALGADA